MIRSALCAARGVVSLRATFGFGRRSLRGSMASNVATPPAVLSPAAPAALFARQSLSVLRRPAGSLAPRRPRAPNAPFLQSTAAGGGHSRFLSALSEDDLRARLDAFQDLFVEARLSIEDCADSTDTTYFDEEAEAAKEAVDEAVAAFEALLGELDEETRGRVMRQNGLKVEQLKGELELVLGGGHH